MKPDPEDYRLIDYRTSILIEEEAVDPKDAWWVALGEWNRDAVGFCVKWNAHKEEAHKRLTEQLEAIGRGENVPINRQACQKSVEEYRRQKEEENDYRRRTGMAVDEDVH